MNSWPLESETAPSPSVNRMKILLDASQPKVVGSFGSLSAIQSFAQENRENICDIAEIRLDLLIAENESYKSVTWQCLGETPLLFTARRSDEGGQGNLDAHTRGKLLHEVLDIATFIDVEVASISEMSDLLTEISERKIPWIASYHDFKKLPSNAALKHALEKAKDAGATVFKAAALLENIADLARLAEFQQEDHGILVSTMGMGALAPVSRLLCAQYGSVLNYGYIGDSPTAPGQWDSALLKQAISRLA